MAKQKNSPRRASMFLPVAGALLIGAAGGFIAGWQVRGSNKTETAIAKPQEPGPAGNTTKDVPPPQIPVSSKDALRQQFDAAKTEREVDKVREDAFLAMVKKSGLTAGQRTDLRNEIDAAYASAWKRVALPGVTLLKSFVRRGIAKNGTEYQEVAITFKNTGPATVAEVWGLYAVAGHDGKLLEGRDKLCFYAAEEGEKGIAPGETYTVPPGSGRWMESKAPTGECIVTIDRVVHR